MKNLALSLSLLIIILSCQSQDNNVSGDKDANKRELLGIFGGMGPEATSDLFASVIKKTPALKDQDHLPTLVYSLPQVPDRMSSIENDDPAIIPYLVEGVKLLEDAGAVIIAIPCNTVHYYYDIMNDTVDIPIINMIRETVNDVKLKYPDAKKIGLLATTGTISTGLYSNEFEKQGYTVVTPDDNIENDYVMKAVFGIKSGVDRQSNEDLLAVASDNVIAKGAEVIVLGCTEIPLAFNPERSSVPVVNATKVLALKAIEEYKRLTE